MTDHDGPPAWLLENMAKFALNAARIRAAEKLALLHPDEFRRLVELEIARDPTLQRHP